MRRKRSVLLPRQPLRCARFPYLVSVVEEEDLAEVEVAELDRRAVQLARCAHEPLLAPFAELHGLSSFESRELRKQPISLAEGEPWREANNIFFLRSIVYKNCRDPWPVVQTPSLRYVPAKAVVHRPNSRSGAPS